MRLNSKGKLAKFYMWLPPEDKKLPQDFCSYFWGLVARVFFIFGMGGLVVVSLVYWAVRFVLWLSHLIWAHKGPSLIVLAFILFIALSVWLSERKKKIKTEILSEAKAIISGKIDSVKNRYCPRIEWTRGNVPERDAETTTER